MKKRNGRKAFIASVLATLLSITMLAGTTFAWFTDSATSGGNIIKSGILNIDFGIRKAGESDYTSVKDDPTLKAFDYDLWEPGYTEWVNAKVYTTGNLAVKYTMRIIANGTVSDLADVIDVYYVPQEVSIPSTRPADLSAAGLVKIGTLRDAINGTITVSDHLIPGQNEEDFATLALHMQETAGNEYQNLSIGTDFSLQILATQYTYEEDSFDNQYDAFADGTPDHPEYQTGGATVVDGEDTVLSTPIITVTVPAGSSNAEAGDTLTLIVEPSSEDQGISVVSNSSLTTYDVSLVNSAGDKVSNTDRGMKVELKVGVVDLIDFYHHTTALTRVDSLEAVDEVGEYFYDISTGIITYLTDTFSPFSANYLFAGGIGTTAYPYLLDNTDQLYNVDMYIGERYPEGGTDTVYYKLLNDLNVAADDGSSWCHSSLYDDTRSFSINLNGKTILLGTKYLYGYAVNLEMHNGTFAFGGVGTAVIGYACYQNATSYNVNFHDLTLTGSIVNNGNPHFGPLVAYGFGLNSGSAVFTADKIVNNLTINSANSDGYVGGLFGYIQGSNVSASVTNCTFNGSISASHTGAFINTCSAPKAGVTSSGNVLNGTLFGTRDARAFGCNGNVAGGSAALNEMNNSVTLGENAVITAIAPTSDLFFVDSENRISFRKVDGAASYRAAIFFSVGQGFPRYITKDFVEDGSETYDSGLFKYGIKNESSNGSTSENVLYDRNGSVMWLADGFYHFYSEDYNVTSRNATIAVYAFDASGNIVAYNTIAYPIN